MTRQSTISFLLSFSLILLIACGGAESDGSDSTTASTPETSEPSETTSTTEESTSSSSSIDQEALKASMERGAKVYAANCVACHQASGEGMAGVFPPLAKADYLMADVTRAIRQVIYGKQGEMVVNGVTYNGMMPAQMINDEQVADVLNYVMNSWGNEADVLVTAEMAAAQR